METTANKMNFKRVNNDVYGNPRYVFHFHDFISEEEHNGGMTSEEKYSLAHKRAKSIGARVYKGKDFGGGFVFQSYNTSALQKRIIDTHGKYPNV